MERSNIIEKYKWNLEDIFKSQNEFNKLYKETESAINFSEYKGKLGEKDFFKRFLALDEKLSKNVEKLYVYAMLKRDTDTKDAKNSELLSKAVMLLVKFNTETSFVLPELTSLDERVIKDYINDPEFSNYDYNLKTILKKKQKQLFHNLFAQLQINLIYYYSYYLFFHYQQLTQ